ncbi:helix-turn-helix transcriptional regulator [Bisgaard Taxon 10/6]|nr:helix-turn-helix transcriptional regulator [Exercitatus varius]MDG2955141.1 helix-turn-helix transcriptional regulator [Exercitatus varius]
MTIKAFSEQTEIPYRSVQSYLRAERELSIEAAIKIAKAFDISLNWLVLGQGKMYVGSTAELTLNSDELNLLEKYRSTTELGKNIVKSTCNAICDELNYYDKQGKCNGS